MPLVKVLKPVFGEGWQVGDIVGMDDESARIPLINKDVEERMQHLEITTILPCINHCGYCPQNKLMSVYPGVKKMSLSSFKKILDNVPQEIDVHFSGFSEAFANRESALMMKHAVEKGHNVIVYTTLNGITDEDINIIKDLNITHFVVHKIGQKAIELPFKAHTIVVDNPISRAGHLWDNKVNIPNAVCSRSEDFKQNVVLPNGDVYLCCMDYGLEHKLGNLLKTNFDDLKRDKMYKLCQKCEAAKSL